MEVSRQQQKTVINLRSKMQAEHSIPAGIEHVTLDIAIVGGGIAGLATAVALRRAGHKVTVCTTRLFHLSICILADHT